MNIDKTNATMNNSKKIDFSISNEDKNNILSGKTLLSTLFGAGTALAFVSGKDMLNGDEPTEVVAVEEEADCTVTVVMEEEVIEVASDLSFAEAFAAQRELQGEGGLFKYNDNYYNTYYKEEWEDLSDTDKSDYFAGIEDLIDYEASQIVDNSNGEVVNIDVDDSEVLEMTTGFDDAEQPEEVIVEPSSDMGNEEVETFVVDESANVEDGDEFVDSEDADFIDDEDLVDPTNLIDEGDLVDPTEELLSTEDLIDDLPTLEGDVLPDPIDNVDLSDFDF